jgi:hypothetical protein
MPFPSGGCEDGDGFFEPSDDRTGLSQNAKPLFSGSFSGRSLCWRAKRGISLASGPIFWEATPVGIHPRIAW